MPRNCAGVSLLVRHLTVVSALWAPRSTEEGRAMATKVWMGRATLAECDTFAQSVSALLAEIEARGGRYRESHTSMIDDNGTLLVLLTIIYDEEAGDHAGGAPT